MILKYEHYQLNNKSVFERVTFSPPFKPSVTYVDEACFVYSISGNGKLFGGIESEKVSSNESILMKCGSFLNHWMSAKADLPCEIIAIHITPDILETIYENKIPEFLTQPPKYSNKVFQKFRYLIFIYRF